MKSITLVAVGVLLGVAVMLAVPHGPPQIVYAGTPSGNGDVNGSGRIDIADAIYILSYLFAQGPEPTVIERVGGSLPATGQTLCYRDNDPPDQYGNVIECSTEGFTGEDGFYQTGCPTAGRFVDNGDGTVTDYCTGLMWQKEPADTNGDGTRDWEGDRIAWRTALQYCETLTFAGNDDWRLPNVRELQSILDYGRIGPCLDPVLGDVSGWYWTATTSMLHPQLAWLINFSSANIEEDGKDNSRLIRAVRGGL